MEAFAKRIAAHRDHVRNVGVHCTTEETTKQALILPMLDALGFSPYDPTRVKAEFSADFPGAKATERVDYALFCHGVPVMFIEAKGYKEKLTNHCPQLARYFNATPEVTVAAITNGREWRFFTDLKDKNIMDREPFLRIDFDSDDLSFVEGLFGFRHDQFQPDALRTLAEEAVYVSSFKRVVTASLREVDVDFVRYVATKAQLQRQLNARFIEAIMPLVRLGVEQAVSEMVVSSLSHAKPEVAVVATPATPESEEDVRADWVNPENSRIVTTYMERRLLVVAEEILGEGSELTGKDTESYYTILYQGKANRWLLRYYGDKKRPTIVLPFALGEQQMREISRAGLDIVAGNQIMMERPENLMRISGLIFDALAHCQNDDNFKRSVS